MAQECDPLFTHSFSVGGKQSGAFAVHFQFFPFRPLFFALDNVVQNAAVFPFGDMLQSGAVFRLEDEFFLFPQDFLKVLPLGELCL